MKTFLVFSCNAFLVVKGQSTRRASTSRKKLTAPCLKSKRLSNVHKIKIEPHVTQQGSISAAMERKAVFTGNPQVAHVQLAQ